MRTRARKQGSAILCLTGLSGAGKSTLVRGIADRDGAVRPIEILDSEELRERHGRLRFSCNREKQ